LAVILALLAVEIKGRYRRRPATAAIRRVLVVTAELPKMIEKGEGMFADRA